MIIATIVEGPSDHEVIKTIVNRLLPGSHRYLPLQPVSSLNENGEVAYGETGTGWKGVRRWCRETWQRSESSLDALLESVDNAPIDLLIMHIDADIVENEDLQDGSDDPIDLANTPCPPIRETVENLKHVILNWLNRQTLPPQVAFMIPSQDTENWVFAALYSSDPLCLQEDYECIKTGSRQREHPGYLLTLEKYGRLLRYRDGKIKKSGRMYQNLLPPLSTHWDNVCSISSQAQNFSQDVLQIAAGGFPSDAAI